MFEWLLKRFSSTLYVQMWRDRVKVTNTKTGEVFDSEPVLHLKNGKVVGIGKLRPSEQQWVSETIKPFNHPRVLLADFISAETLLRVIFKSILGKSHLIRPIVIMHPMENMEGGYTAIENRAFRELALTAGARVIFLHKGRELSIGEINARKFKGADWE